MAIRQFSIILDTNRQVFYPGETLSGNVVLDVSGAYKVNGITLKFEGEFICSYIQLEIISISNFFKD